MYSRGMTALFGGVLTGCMGMACAMRISRAHRKEGSRIYYSEPRTQLFRIGVYWSQDEAQVSVGEEAERWGGWTSKQGLTPGPNTR